MSGRDGMSIFLGCAVLGVSIGGGLIVAADRLGGKLGSAVSGFKPAANKAAAAHATIGRGCVSVANVASRPWPQHLVPWRRCGLALSLPCVGVRQLGGATRDARLAAD